MVIDDDPAVCRYIAMVLHSLGASVAVETDPNRGLERLRIAPFDLLFADWQMPHLDGLEVIRAASKSNPRMATILITGYGSVNSSVEAIRLGVADLLVKPITRDHIVDAVARVINQVAYEGERAQPAMLLSLHGELKELERTIVGEVVARHQGNKSAAARALGLHRKTLYRILNESQGDQPLAME